MREVSFWFLFAGVIWVTLGMVWGIEMGITDNHLMAPAHAHLNLTGFVLFSLFGIYYRLTPSAAVSGLSRLHIGLALGGVVTFIPGMALAISGGSHGLVILGSLLTLGSMLVFLVTVWRHGFAAPA